MFRPAAIRSAAFKPLLAGANIAARRQIGGYARITLIGNIGGKPELFTSEGGKPSVRFGLAVNESWTDQAGERRQNTSWYTIQSYRQSIHNYLTELPKG
jgi:single stranded DNA-binding protein